MTDAAEQTKPWPAMSIAQAHAILTAPGMPFEMEEIDIGGVKTRTWKNAPPTLRSVVEAGRQHGEKIFLVYEDERASFEAFYRAVSAFAHELHAKGVRKGDRVAIVMRNLPEWPVAFYAGEALGAIVTPLNAWWTGPELEYGLADSGTKIAIVDDERLSRVAEFLDGLPALERVYVSRATEPLSHPKLAPLEAVIGPVNGWGALPDLPLPQVDLGPE